MYLGVFYLPTETRVNAASFLRQSLEQRDRVQVRNTDVQGPAGCFELDADI